MPTITTIVPNLVAQHRDIKKTSIAKVDAFVTALETCFSINEINGSEATMKSFIAHSDELMNDFDKQYFEKKTYL